MPAWTAAQSAALRAASGAAWAAPSTPPSAPLLSPPSTFPSTAREAAAEERWLTLNPQPLAVNPAEVWAEQRDLALAEVGEIENLLEALRGTLD